MRNTRRVLVAVSGLEGRAPRTLERLREEGFELVVEDRGRALSEDELLAAIPGIFATIASSEPYNERVLAAADELAVIARMGVGFDRVDVAAATRHGVAVAMAFGTNHEAVADHAFSLIAALGSQVLPYHAKVLGGGWGGNVHSSLWRATMGIVGLGRIGKALARRCQGFEMRILAHDIAPDRAFAERHGIELVPLDELLEQSDFVSVHTPHDATTDKLIGRDQLARMKPTAYLINTSRGGTVDETALALALAEKRIAGAGLDVMAIEPLPASSPLRTLDNVLLTPHCAGTNTRSLVDMLDRCIDSIIAIRDGRSPGDHLLLNPEVLRQREARR
jgi:D-3-phosphoglycerate dehydrogenase / 2-oxoglutarate reductase